MGLSYNQACWLNFIRASQAYQVGKTTFRTRFIPAQIYAAAMATGNVSKDDIEMALRGAGYDIPYDAAQYSLGASGIWSPDDAYQNNDYQLMDNQIGKVIADMNQINTDMQNVSVAGSTAKGVDYVQAKQSALNQAYLRRLTDNVLQPFCEMFLDDLLLLIQEEVIAIDLTDERIAEIASSKEQLINVFRKTGQEILQQKIISQQGEIPVVMGTKINPILEKEYITLNQSLLSNFKANIDIEINGNTFDVMQAKQDNLELMNLIQSMPEGSAKQQALIMAIQEYLELRNNKNKKQYMGLLTAQQEESEEQARLAQAQQAELESKAIKNQSEAELKKAQAAEEFSRADKQNLENEMLAQVGAAAGM
jgi:hypothetical protein